MERQSFEVSVWRLRLRVAAAWLISLVILYIAAFGATSTARAPRLLVAAAAIWTLWQGVVLWRGLRRIRIEGPMVHAEFGGGRKDSWLLSDLAALNPTTAGQWPGTVNVRVRSTGAVAFTVTRDLAGWRVLLTRIPSIGAPA
jgi:hypothetical protein